MNTSSVNPGILHNIEKIRESLEEGRISVEELPMKTIDDLLEVTMGEALWAGRTNIRSEGYATLPGVYKKLFRDLAERKDTNGCAGLLELFETQYKRLYHILAVQERYQNTAKEIGTAWSERQYELHEKRQGYWEGNAKPFSHKRGVVYTCLFAENMQIMEPIYRNAFWDYICFTDQEEKWGKKEGIWLFLKPVRPENWNNNLLINYYRINSHKIFKDYDFSIWIDPQMHIIGELEQWYEDYGKNASFLAFPDSRSDSIYDVISTNLKEDDRNIANRKKIFRYREEGYPEHYGLVDVRCLYKNHGDMALCQVLEEWWEEVVQDTVYGKYGFNYAAWKNDFKFALCNQFSEENWYMIRREME